MSFLNLLPLFLLLIIFYSLFPLVSLFVPSSLPHVSALCVYPILLQVTLERNPFIPRLSNTSLGEKMERDKKQILIPKLVSLHKLVIIEREIEERRIPELD